MKCPGCNFVCSELRDICPKCVSDLRPFKIANGLPVTDAAATTEELIARVKGRTILASSSTSPTHSLLGGVLSVISQVVGGRPTNTISGKETAHTPPPVSPEIPLSIDRKDEETEKREEPQSSTIAEPQTTTTEAQPRSEEESITTLVFTEDLFPSCASAAGPHSQVFEWVVPAPLREEERTLTLESSTPSELQEENTTDLHTVSSEIEVDPPTTHSSVFNYSSEDQSILPEMPGEYENPRVVPTEHGIVVADDVVSNDATPNDSVPNDTVPSNTVGQTTLENVNAKSTLAEEHYHESHSEPQIPPSKVTHPSPTENSPQPHTDSSTTYREVLELTPLPWNGDTDSVEEAFGEAFSDIRSLTASATIQTDHLFHHSAIDSEQILLHFSLALDELEGRLKVEKVINVTTSDNRHVETPVIDSALQEVQSFLNKADQPAPLKEFIQETLAEQNTHHQELTKKDLVGFSPRILAISIDITTTFFTCLLLTSLLERGGLTELLADLSVNGFRTRHYHWLIASLGLVPLTYILYHFLTLPLLHATVGERVAGISIRSRNGRPIKGRHITFRALSAPLATLLGSPLFVLFGRPALLDHLSGTDMHHVDAD
jgi:hypothetical protein